MRFERQVRSLSRRKVVMVIVEGPSDDEALELLFNRIYDQNVERLASLNKVWVSIPYSVYYMSCNFVYV